MALLHFYSQAKNDHSIIRNATSTRDQANHRQIIPLLDDLESHGVTVTNGAKFREIVAYQPVGHVDPDPFTTDPADAHEAIMAHTARASATQNSSAWGNYIQSAGRTLLASMASEADTYITTMQPAFNTAAATIASALTHGLDENTTYEALVNNGTPEQISAWRAALEARTTLDRIAASRIAMSAWLNLPPQGNANYNIEVPDYTPAFVHATAPMSPDPSQVSQNSITHRWLHLQNASGTALHLATTAELDAVGYQLGYAVA